MRVRFPLVAFPPRCPPGQENRAVSVASKRAGRYRCPVAQRRGIAFFRPEARPATVTGAQMRGAAAIGALAVGAAAVGGFAIGRLTVGRLSIDRAAINRLKIGELEVERLNLPDDSP